MSLKVITLVQYRTGTEPAWRNVDYEASKLVKALKGKPFNGYAYVTVAGRAYRFDSTTPASMIASWCGLLAASAIQTEGWGPHFLVVPVPSSRTVAGVSPRPSWASREFAAAVATALGASASLLDVLSFQKQMLQAHAEGGTRDPEELRESLHLAPAHFLKPVLLVDDVFTTGGHLLAAAAKLREAGATVVGAIALGRTEREEEPNPLQARTVELADHLTADDFIDDGDDEHVPGTCLRCASPALVESATCPECDTDADVDGEPIAISWDHEHPVAYFEDYDSRRYTPACSACGTRPLIYQFALFCSYCQHQADKLRDD